MKLLTRYLAHSFIGPFFVSAVFFIVFLLTFQLFRIMKIIINKGVEISTIFELLGHIALSFVPLAVPLSTLFATLYALNKLSEDSEIIAMRSFGLSKFKLLFPFLFCSIFIAVTVFFLNRNIIPGSKTKFKNTIIKLTSRGMINDIRPEVFYHEIPGVTLFAEKVIDGGKRMEKIFIHSRAGKNSEERVIMANSGSLVRIQENEGEPPNLRLYLKEGNIMKTSKDGSNVEKAVFYEYDFPLFEESFRPGFVNKDNMKTTSELRRFIRHKTNELKTLKKEGADKNRIGDIIGSIYKSKLEYWTRINTPLQIVLFSLIGFCYGIKKGRGKEKNSGGIIMGFLIGYYALFFFGMSLSKKGHIGPELAIFLPTVLFALIVSRAYKRLDWLG